jgi:hypothetical protein
MALTFTKRLEMSVGNKKMSMYDVTHDGATGSIDAADIGLHYIDHSMCGQTNQGTDVATDTAEITVNNGEYITITALSTTAVTTIWAIGW